MTPYFERDGISLFCARAEDVLPSLPDQSVDLIATDPPYFRVKGEAWDRQWDHRDAFLAWVGTMADEWRRVLKPSGSLYVFASPDLAWHVEGLIREQFTWLNTIRWEKDAGWHNKADEEALRSYLSPWEAIVFAEQKADEYEDASLALHKQVYAPIGRFISERRIAAGFTRGDVDAACSPSKKPTGLCYRWEEGACLPTLAQFVAFMRLCGDGREYEALRREYEALRRPFNLTPTSPRADIWRFPTVAPYPHKHPCEKPLALMEHIVSSSSKPGDIVLDCFAGSGTTLDACRNLGRRAIGVEASQRFARQAANRLSQTTFLLEVPA